MRPPGVPAPPRGKGPRQEISKTERILNLVSFLLNSRVAVSWSEIREKVIGYGDQADDKTLERRFERDKKELRRIGIPVRYVADDGFGNAGYGIPKDQYFLPPVRLSAEETHLLHYLSVSALSEETGPLAEYLASALLKFTYDSVDLGGAAEHWRRLGIHPDTRKRRAGRAGRRESNLRLLSDAVFTNRRVTFSYYTFYRDSVESRKVDPYGLGVVRGLWYLVGYSHEREEIRSFRVDRIQGEVKVSRKEHTFAPPDGFRIEGYVGKRPWEMAPGKPTSALVRFHPDIAWMVPGEIGHPEPLRTDKDGWGRLELDVYAPERLFPWILRYGDQAEIVSPVALRRAFVEMLRATREKYG